MELSTNLNLVFPTFNYKLKQKDGKLYIFDEIAKKFRLLTPEEWVRQHCLHYLISELNYPSGLIQIEGNLKINQLNRRTDIRIYQNDGSVFMIIECKAPHVAITDVTLSQISQYQKNHDAKFVAMTNGLEIQTFEIQQLNKEITSNNQFPSYL
ncbi:type I restriction enzyme HsdR N-terminal domain-containing protein [Aquirufa sp. ROCK2-A2]